MIHRSSCFFIAAVLTALVSASAAEPTALEQYMLELINRARADGNAESARHGLSSLQAGDPSINGEAWIIQPSAPPLTWNEQLTTAARTQAQLLFTAGFTSGNAHSYGGTTPELRILAAGFTVCPSITCPRPSTPFGAFPGVENFAFAARSPAFPSLQAEMDTMHRLLFVDSSTPGRMHRITIMYPWFREVGLGLVYGHIGTGDRAYFFMDFNKAAPGIQVFLTGVVYNDIVTADQFYTPGEGLGGLLVQAWQSGVKMAETTTWASGGYRLPLAGGTYEVKLVNSQGHVANMGPAGHHRSKC